MYGIKILTNINLFIIFFLDNKILYLRTFIFIYLKTSPMKQLFFPKSYQKCPGLGRKVILIILLSTIVSASSYAQMQKDSLAIISLLQDEATSWRMGDIEKHASYWSAKPYSTVFVSAANGEVYNVPVENMISPTKNMVGNGGLAHFFDIKMNIGPKQAWVSHQEISVSKEGEETLSYEVRMLEKEKDDWKLVGQSMHVVPHPKKQDTISYVQTVDVTTGKIETILQIEKHFEAPNWHPDGYLILNSGGLLYTLDLNSRLLNILPSDFANACNNDHGISPDLKWLAISHNNKQDPSPKAYKSAIYVIPIEGGTPRRVTDEVMSFWHGWSPDGKRLAYCAERNGNYDVYTISVNGGKEKRLTRTEGLDDGPEYSPDGKYIYFNSYRTGHMQIWRMKTNGTKPEQLTFDTNSNWFPHLSPDGKYMAYIAYTSDQKQNHLFGKQVKLRVMDLETKEIKDLTPVFYGGQGTINVPSWSPDSKKIAFVSYSVH